jgi:hypothetical protein
MRRSKTRAEIRRREELRKSKDGSIVGVTRDQINALVTRPVTSRLVRVQVRLALIFGETSCRRLLKESWLLEVTYNYWRIKT